jgi:hypothetical protein
MAGEIDTGMNNNQQADLNMKFAASDAGKSASEILFNDTSLRDVQTAGTDKSYLQEGAGFRGVTADQIRTICERETAYLGATLQVAMGSSSRSSSSNTASIQNIG